jgi:hypothetical protein
VDRQAKAKLDTRGRRRDSLFHILMSKQANEAILLYRKHGFEAVQCGNRAAIRHHPAEPMLQR